MKFKRQIRDFLLMIFILVLSFAVSIVIQEVFNIGSLASMIFVMAVFLVSVFTQGYAWGIIAALISVLAVNFAFTFPFFKINFNIPENLFSGIVLLVVSVITSALTTKLKKQERMRAENEKEKVRANLLRAVSHDLRTPLTSIYGSCSTIIENYDALSKEQHLKLLSDVCSDAEWLNRMVENLLSVTRIDNGSVSVVKSPTVLEELLDSVLVKFKKHYPNQDVEVEIPDDFVVIPMDSILIEQVIINLLENAVIHAKGMTTLKLTTFVLGNRAVFEVADNGCGIPREQLNTILTGNYNKSITSADNEGRGMGIGLSVCNTIIKAHGGDMQVESKVSAGTIIRFSLETEDVDNEQQV